MKLLLPLLLLLPSLAHADADWKWGEIPREQLFVTHFPEAPYADAVVLLDHETVRVDRRNRLKIFRHHRTRIMKEAGRDRAVVRIPFARGSEIKDFRAHTLVPPGHEVKVGKKDIEKREGPDGGEWIVTFPQVSPGVVVEYQYEIRSDRLDFIPAWHFRNRDHTLVSRYDLQLPPGVTHESFFGWTPAVAPSPASDVINDPDDERRQITQWTWQLENQHPVPDLPFVRNPQDYRITLHIQLREAREDVKIFPVRRTWEQLALDAAELDSRILSDTKGVEAWATEAVAGAADPESKARALHRRIRDDITTEPALADGKELATLRDVIESGSGSPLAKNLLLVAALETQGVPARVVRIRSDGTLQVHWHCLEQLDRSLVRVDDAGGVIWADASAPHCPMGMLPIEDRVDQGLLVGEGGGLIAIQLPSVQSERIVTTVGRIDRDGALVAKATLELKGYPALKACAGLESGSESAFVEQVLRDRFGDGATLVSHQVTRGEDADAGLGVEIEYRIADWARRNGEKFTGEVPWLFAVDANELAAEDREIPVDFGFAGGTRETVTLEVPEGFFVVSVPDRKTARMAEMNYKTTHTMDRTTLASTREVNVRRAVVAELDYEKLRQLWDKVAAADAATFTVGRQPVRAPTGTR